MEELKDDKEIMVKNQNTREHLANERTFLAWMRTSIAIMAFGFVVVKFSLFIRQLSLLLNKNINLPHSFYSSFIGIILVLVGAIVLIFSFFNYKQTQKQITNSTFQSSSTLVFVLTIIILILSVFLIMYLIENTNSQ